jgi:transcriptional regulator with XRE-family HTH domain
VEHLYERIKDARERAGLTVGEAAERLGVSRVQVWRMENKAETITAERLFVLAAVYDIDPSVVFKGVAATTQSTTALYKRIGEVVAMVEAEVQRLDAKPPPDVVGEAVVEILRQETRGRTSPPSEPLDIEKYQGLIALLIKQATRS